MLLAQHFVTTKTQMTVQKHEAYQVTVKKPCPWSESKLDCIYIEAPWLIIHFLLNYRHDQ